MSSRRRRRLKWVITGSIVFLALALLLSPSERRYKTSSPLLSPFTGLRRALANFGRGVAALFTDLGSFHGLSERNRELQQQLKLCREQGLVEKDRKARDDARLKMLDDYFRHAGDDAKRDPRLLVATVIARDATDGSHTIVVDRGSRDGVKPDSAVLAGYAAVGKVKVVGRRASVVELLTSPKCRIHARVLRTREQGIVEGAGRRTCRLKYVYKHRVVAGDGSDVVICSGHFGSFPPGIVIGKVTVVGKPGETDQDPLFQTITLEPAVNLAALETVLIIKKERTEADEFREKYVFRKGKGG